MMHAGVLYCTLHFMHIELTMNKYIDCCVTTDWQYVKLQEKSGKLSKFDYANANTSPKQLALSAVWSSVVGWFLFTFISDCLAGKYATP